ncbi:glucose-1-phosphate adenylyltransferase large subunit, chloroplastic/amyloplastic isoform X2 [Ziziphus jujuba]|uniref:glucose-1-phosphate adenylyltransferase n=1 Tax=Ziziphus jujuba TaxID=326968 RepID=A0ABM3IMB0_ZIZJJ|nr:glucose-1-phosphate adenylyltransferase large subunit, chloroplastic/amyloplastic isoform X2 [Ziziphus jujuba]
MDSCCANLNGNVHLVKASKQGFRNRGTGFWGESIRGSLKGRGLSAQLLKSLKSESRVRKLTPGASYSVLTSNINKESVTVQAPIFETPQAEPKNVASIILGGGAGTRLFPLTSRRAKPAVPIGGCYRLIDIPMSNCINSGIKKIFILTQFNSFSLNRHLARTYNFGNGVNFGDGFVEVLAATQTPGERGKKWFQGTADAVRQFIWVFEDAKNKNVEHILILSGDHLYRMDYMDFVQRHIDTNADITVSCVPMDDGRASDYGLMKIDNAGRIIQFAEKPKGPDLKAMQVDTTLLGLSKLDAVKYPYIASMGVYVFRTDVLLKLLRWSYPSCNDFGSEIIPSAVRDHNVQPPKFEFYDPKTPFFTSPRFLPPTKVEKCRILDAIISHGCFLRECSVEHSIVGVRSRLEQGVELKDTMMMGADYYQTESEIASLLADGKVPIGVGQDTKIRNCIIDKNAKIGRNVVITNGDGVKEAERPKEGFYIRSGITVILKNATIKDGTVI